MGSVDGVWVLQKEKRTENKGKLTIVNRDTEGYCFKVEFEKESCRWLNLGEYEESDGKKEDDFCKVINDFVVSKWEGTATELSDELNINISANAVTKKLNKSKDNLLNEFGINYRYNRLKNKRIISLFREVIVTHQNSDMLTIEDKKMTVIVN